MRYEKKNRISIYITILLAVLLFGTTIYGIACTRKLDKIGTDYDRLTEQLINTTNTNRRLTETVEQCQFIVTELGESTERSIGTVREAIEIIEETREAVNGLEMVLANRSPDSVYERIDNYVFNNE